MDGNSAEIEFEIDLNIVNQTMEASASIEWRAMAS
jgi:hypothetical protein